MRSGVAAVEMLCFEKLTDLFLGCLVTMYSSEHVGAIWLAVDIFSIVVSIFENVPN